MEPEVLAQIRSLVERLNLTQVQAAGSYGRLLRLASMQRLADLTPEQLQERVSAHEQMQKELAEHIRNAHPRPQLQTQCTDEDVRQAVTMNRAARRATQKMKRGV